MKPARAAPLALTGVCIGILAWRVPLIHRGGTHAKARRASAGGGGSALFQAVRLGQIGAAESYWRQTRAPMPDRLMSVSWHLADSLGIEGVPVLIVSHRGSVTAAWLGHLAWGEADITRAIRCRLGNGVSCAILYAADVVRGVGGARADATVTAEPHDTPARPALP